MHRGKTQPFMLDARVFMGPWEYDNWIREAYSIDSSLVPFWHGPLASEMTAPQPYACERVAALEASIDERCLAGFVQATTLGDVYLGFRLKLQPDRVTVHLHDQVWLDGEPQMDETDSFYIPPNWQLFFSFVNGHAPLPGASLWSSGCGYTAIPYN